MAKKVKKQKNLYNPKTKTFTGKAVGVIQVGTISMESKGTIQMASIEIARRTLESAFIEGMADPEARKHLDAFVARMDKIKSDEDPFVILHDFMFHFRQFDMFDWRRAGLTARNIKRRDNRLERGEISGEREYKARHHDADEVWDGELDYSSSFARLGKDVAFMPVFKSNEDMEAYAEKRDLNIDLEGCLDESFLDSELDEFEANKYSSLSIEDVVFNQLPCLRLSTKDENGSWAIYAMLDDDSFVRVFQMRTSQLKPKGPDLRLNSASKKLAREIQAQKSASIH